LVAHIRLFSAKIRIQAVNHIYSSLAFQLIFIHFWKMKWKKFLNRLGLIIIGVIILSGGVIFWSHTKIESTSNDYIFNSLTNLLSEVKVEDGLALKGLNNGYSASIQDYQSSPSKISSERTKP
jgi:hypothetical protein